MKIGIFDSGLGGKVVLDAVRDHMPLYDYAYYGDTAHVPYGGRSEAQIYELTKAGVEYLMGQQDCLTVVLACNTASAETLRRLQDQWLPAHYPDRRILGVIIPTIETVIETQCTRVLLLATARTVSAGKYHLELGKRNELHTKIIAQATPDLVPLIEAGDMTGATALAAQYIDTYVAQGEDIDGVILGCTHYSLLVGELRRQFSHMTFFAQTELVPDKLQAYLGAHTDLEGRLTTGGTTQTFFTGAEHGAGEV